MYTVQVGGIGEPGPYYLIFPIISYASLINFITPITPKRSYNKTVKAGFFPLPADSFWSRYLNLTIPTTVKVFRYRQDSVLSRNRLRWVVMYVFSTKSRLGSSHYVNSLSSRSLPQIFPSPLSTSPSVTRVPQYPAPIIHHTCDHGTMYHSLYVLGQ
jgi:hypothetical protein